MYFITTKRMLEVCFFQHTPTFIIEPYLPGKEIFLTFTYKIMYDKFCTIPVDYE